MMPRKSWRLLLALFVVTEGMAAVGASPTRAGVNCEDFGCVKVELTYNGGRSMRYFIQAYNFRPGTIIADGEIYDSDNLIYINVPPKTCSGQTECVNSGHFNYPDRCDGQVFELVGTGHRREDPQTDIVEDRDLETAPVQMMAEMTVQQTCQR